MHDQSHREQLKPGLWRGEIVIDSVSVPFHFDVIKQDDKTLVFYINDPERMEVEEVVYNGGAEVEFNFPSYSNSLKALIKGEVMSGFVTATRPGGIRKLPFRAEYGKTYRFFKELPQTYKNISGSWVASIDYSGAGVFENYTAHFTQTGSALTGTFESPYGDSRFLSGEIKGNDFFLSIYDGGLLQLWSGKLEADGTLSGHTTNLGSINAPWTAKRAPNAMSPDLTCLAAQKDKSERFDFTFPDLNDRPLSISDKKYNGKVVVVILSASWCPTCHDQAVFFEPFYNKHKERGLEAISLMFEFSSEWKEVKKQVLAFKARYGISYDMAFAGHFDPKSRNAALPQLKQIVTFPTVIIIDRKGKVRKIQPSFPGPAIPSKQQTYIQNFHEFVNRLLTEEPV